MLHGSADRLGRGVSGLSARVDERLSSLSFVPDAENVVLDVRRHPFLLAAPVARTVLGLLALAAGLDLLPLLGFGLAVGGWALSRHRFGLRPAATLAVLVPLALVLLTVLVSGWLAAALLLAWVMEDAADWHADRLVVTDKRIYRRYGVVTRHSPSISLTAIAYLDPAVPPLGQLLGYGTLMLDSVAQRDAPLSRFDMIPDVVGISHEILRLRAAAMPRFPQQPYG